MFQCTVSNSRYFPFLGALALLSIASLVSGCGMGTLNTSVGPQTVATAISGRVHGGHQPISGATVQLWETGTSGYGSGAAQLVGSTTTAITTGHFSFPVSNVPANCTGGPFAYITASGGDPTGQTLSNQNHAILLAVVLGNCTSVGASTVVDIDEVTTAATAYALGNFATVSGAAGSLASLSIGTSSTNAQGLADAVATTALLASSTTGQANASTATMLLPTAALNTVANVAATCVDATEYNVSPCTNVLSLATPPGGTQPGNVFQGLMNIAKYPGNNVTSLLNVGSAFPPFVPALAGGSSGTGTTSVLNDLSLGIAYPNSTLASASTSPTALVVDKNDNVFALGAGSSSTKYMGALASASAGSAFTTSTLAVTTGTPQQAAVDSNNNIWMSDSGSGDVQEIPLETRPAPSRSC
jgi:hypothetical protein